MLKKMVMLLILSILANAENLKNSDVEKFNLNDVKKCSDTNKNLLCRDNPKWLVYKNFNAFQDNKLPICDNNLNNMYIIQEISSEIKEPEIITTKIDNKTTIKQTYKTKILSSHKIKACKNVNEIIIKTEKE